MILDETYEFLKTCYGERLNHVTIERLVSGIHLTAIKLSNGYCGLASNDMNTTDSCLDNRNRGFGIFTPGNFKDQKVAELLSLSDPPCFVKTVQLAAMNALSAEQLSRSGYRIIENIDPIDLIELKPGMQVCVVGAFLSYIKKIAAGNSVLKIIELNEAAIPFEFRRYFVQPESADTILHNSDIVLTCPL